MDRYKADLEALIVRGEQLDVSLGYDCQSKAYRDIWERKFAKELAASKDPKSDPATVKKAAQDAISAHIAKLPNFRQTYQAWYSEAMALISQILPGRLADFVRHYEKPKRKELSNENYAIEDYLQGLQAMRGDEVVVAHSAVMPRFDQQLAILRAARARFESSLFDIRQLVQADLLDSELDVATELSGRGFHRAAGAVAGVVLEHHLAQACQNHSIAISKARPTISTFNDALKGAEAIEIPQWRFIQHLADIRNICDHNKDIEPTAEQVADLIVGVTKITKTLF